MSAWRRKETPPALTRVMAWGVALDAAVVYHGAQNYRRWACINQLGRGSTGSLARGTVGGTIVGCNSISLESSIGAPTGTFRWYLLPLFAGRIPLSQADCPRPGRGARELQSEREKQPGRLVWGRTDGMAGTLRLQREADGVPVPEEAVDDGEPDEGDAASPLSLRIHLFG
jgi:hypothetical protein